MGLRFSGLEQRDSNQACRCCRDQKEEKARRCCSLKTGIRQKPCPLPTVRLPSSSLECSAVSAVQELPYSTHSSTAQAPEHASRCARLATAPSPHVKVRPPAKGSTRRPAPCRTAKHCTPSAKHHLFPCSPSCSHPAQPPSFFVFVFVLLLPHPFPASVLHRPPRRNPLLFGALILPRRLPRRRVAHRHTAPHTRPTSH